MTRPPDDAPQMARPQSRVPDEAFPMKRRVPEPLARALRRAAVRASPVAWANLPGVRWVLARGIPAAHPPVLVVSLPRSGSSWVGAAFDLSPSALYLREPLTQTYLAHATAPVPAEFEVDPRHPPPAYRSAADAAFAGLPSFATRVVRRPERWGLLRRGGRRPVVKEVNPLALEWIIGTYRPRVVLLVRHPAAVAASYFRLGWSGRNLAGRFPPGRLAALGVDPEAHRHSFWSTHGVFQALALERALSALDGYRDARVVHYERLCADPLEVFRDLYAFAGLAWTQPVEAEIARSSTDPGDRQDPYGTRRDSRSMADAWRAEVTGEALREIRDAYLSRDPALYGADAW
jgi:hypothetical protein